MSSHVATAANALTALAYFTIAFIVLRGLGATAQLRLNRLGVATGLIFLTGGVHHAAHALGVDWRWPVAVWDVFGAAVAILYLSQRSHYRGLLTTATMFDDLRARERQALEINDNIVQGLTRIKWALEAGRRDEAGAAADETLEQAQRMITDLLVLAADGDELGPGSLRRAAPAG